MLAHVCQKALGSTTVQLGDKTLHFQPPFKRISMTQSILENTGFDITGKSEHELFEFCKSIGLEVNDTMGKGKLIDEIFGAKCEKTIFNPHLLQTIP